MKENRLTHMQGPCRCFLRETAGRDLDVAPGCGGAEESHPAPKVEQENAKELLQRSQKVAAV